MRTISRRKLMTAGFSVVAGTLALTSAAFACLQFEGKATFGGNGTGSTDRTMVAQNAYHAVCSDTGDTVTVPTAATITITVAPKVSGDCLFGTNNALPTGTYDVLWSKGSTADACRNPSPDNSEGADIGDFSVTSGAGGPSNYSWTATGATGGQFHVCIGIQNRTTNGAHGFGVYVTKV